MIDHLSYSSISTYCLCPRSWKFHYIDQIKTPTAPVLVFGSALHNTVEAYLASRSAFGHPFIMSELWSTNWAAQLERESNIAWDTTPETYFNQGLQMLTDPEIVETIQRLNPMVAAWPPNETGQEQTVWIEKQVNLQVPGVPVPITGYIDLITADGVPCDFKSSARSWNLDKAQEELQPLFYLAALNQLGLMQHAYRFRHVVFVKTKKPGVQVLETTRSIHEIFWLFGLIADVWQAIEKGAFPPNSTGWKCSDKFCDYWGICRGKGR